MSRLIITDEEKAAHSYLDWDDASIGRCVKALAMVNADIAAEKQCLENTCAGLTLVGNCLDINATTCTVTMSGCTIGDKEIGDWKITVEKVNHAN